MKQLDFNLCYRWLVDLGTNDGACDASVFCKNHDQLLDAQISRNFLNGIITHKWVRHLWSMENFSVDITLEEAGASMKSFVPREKDENDEAPRDNDHSGGRIAEHDF